MTGSGIITRLRKKYTRLRIVEIILVSLGAGGALWAAGSWLGLNPIVCTTSSLAFASLLVVIRVKSLGLLNLSDDRIAFFLNSQYPQLQDSSELLIRQGNQLSPIEQLQAARTERALDSLDAVQLPHWIRGAVLIFLVGLAGAFSSGFITRDETPQQSSRPGDNSQAADSTSTVPELSAHSITIQPPDYTSLKGSSTEKLSATVPEGSVVTWKLKFTRSPANVKLQFATGDSISLTKNDGHYVVSKKIQESSIYQVAWNSHGSKHSSDYFEITMKPDAAPQVNIVKLQQFTRLGWGERNSIDVGVEMRDDFGLSSGHIIATVSKGSGESIKFREEKLVFDSPSSVRGKAVNARRKIDFNAMGMEPGDEIYFYAEAWDNKTPLSQRMRTETYFVSLQDTASQAIVADASLGVDLMPEYFRSQRQIIIDTEKLLKDQPNISKQAFKSTSNELGYDQKVLRLKYGQFLGEEFETTIGAPAHEEAEEESDEEDPSKKFGHQHDKDNEHNLVPEKKPEPGHEHDEEDGDDPTAAFKHNHDNMEEATFFTQSVRSKLKAALTLMWDSELQLRLYEPKASLPIQYKILKLLKEISQDSRIYVHRMGFDPPPLKEEKRLTGDLEEIPDRNLSSNDQGEKPYPAIRKAVTSLNEAIQSGISIPADQLKSDLESAASEIAAVSIATPGSYLVQLSMIRSILDGKLNESEYLPALLEIRSACWQILPNEGEGPGRLQGVRHPLDNGLLKELKKQPND